MSYTPTNWKKGDIVTSAKLNNMEDGIKDNEHIVAEFLEDETSVNIGTNLSMLELSNLKIITPSDTDSPKTIHSIIFCEERDDLADADYNLSVTEGVYFTYSSATGVLTKQSIS